MTQSFSTGGSSPDLDISQWIHLDELCASEETIDIFAQSHREQSTDESAKNAGSLPGSLATNHGEHAPLTTTKHALKGSMAEDVDSKSKFSVICFSSDPARPEGKKKKRRDFTERRRQEVAQIRKAGACLRCKIRRTSVSLTEILDSSFSGMFCDILITAVWARHTM